MRALRKLIKKKEIIEASFELQKKIFDRLEDSIQKQDTKDIYIKDLRAKNDMLRAKNEKREAEFSKLMSKCD